MARRVIQINDIFHGQSPTYYRGGSYLSSGGIDLDKKINGKTGAVISPTTLEVKAQLDGKAMWAVPNPVTKNTLVYTDTGWLYLVDEELNLVNEDEAGNPFPHRVSDPYEDDAHGNGLAFYNNYYYILKDTNIDRYGPFDDLTKLAFEKNWWTGVTQKKSLQTSAYGFSSGRGHYVDTVKFEQLEFNATFYAGTPADSPPTNGTVRKSAVILEYGSRAGNAYVTPIKKFDLLLGLWNQGPLETQDGDVRISFQTTTGTGATRFPSGTILAEKTFPLRTDSTDSDETDLKTVFPAGSEILYTVELEETFNWVKGEHSHIALVLEVINTSVPDVTAFAKGAELSELWDRDIWRGWVVQETYEDSAWSWKRFNNDNKAMFALRFYEEEPLFQPLSPEGVAGGLPNHTAYVHRGDNNLYLTNNDQVARVQTRRSATLLYWTWSSNAVLKLIPGNTLVGQTSGARATIINTVSNEADRNETIFSHPEGYSQFNQPFVFEMIKGEFIEHERILNLQGEYLGAILDIQFGYYTGQLTDPNALRLPSYQKAVDLASYGLDIAILSHKELSDSFDSSMILWNAVSNFFDREVPIPNKLATAIFSGLGSVNVFYGEDDGYSLATYVGGERFQTLFHRDDSTSPLKGSIYTEYDRVLWGTKQTYPESRLSVLSYGMKDATLPKGVHNVFSVDTDDTVTALMKYPKLGVFTDKLYIEGENDTDSFFRTAMYTINDSFDVKSIRFSLERPVDEHTEIEVRVYSDNESKVELVDTISAVKFKGKRIITLRPRTGAFNNFFVEFRYKGDDNGILLPIEIVIEDEKVGA